MPDTGTPLAQAGRDARLVVAETRYDSNPGHHHTRHIRTLESIRGGEQADTQITRGVDLAVIHQYPAVTNGQYQLAFDDTLDVYLIAYLAGARQHLAEEFHFPHAQSPATAGKILPGKKEAHQLPQGVEAQTAGHHRIPLEMAREEP